MASRFVFFSALKMSVGTQAGFFDYRQLSGYILDLLIKCHEVRGAFIKCEEDLKRGREDICASECAVDKMQSTVKNISATMDAISGRLLHGNTAFAQRKAYLERLRAEIESTKAMIARLEAPETAEMTESERAQHVVVEKERLELQLTRVRRDIDNTYEDIFEAEEKLYTLKDLRLVRREDEQRQLDVMKETATHAYERKREILSLMETGSSVMAGIYVSPVEFKKLETDIEALKHKQVQMERRIAMQTEERTFQRQTVDDIQKKVYTLEKKVRKETGDHGLNPSYPKEPNWFQDLSGPSIWYGSPRLSGDQLRRLAKRQSNLTAGCDDSDADDTDELERITTQDIIRHNATSI